MATVNPINSDAYPSNSDSYGFSPVATTPAGMAAPAPASKVRAYALVGLCFGAVFCLGSLVVASVDAVEERDGTLVLDVAGGWEAPAPHARCAWIEDEARARDAGKTKGELAAQYLSLHSLRRSLKRIFCRGEVNLHRVELGLVERRGVKSRQHEPRLFERFRGLRGLRRLLLELAQLHPIGGEHREVRAQIGQRHEGQRVTFRRRHMSRRKTGSRLFVH